MANEEKQFENAAPIVKVVEALREVIDRDIDLGLYTPDTLKKMRLTVEARREAVRQLAHEGKTQSQIARDMGMSHTQVARDLGKLAHNVQKIAPKVQQRILQAKEEAREEMLQAFAVERKTFQDELILADQKNNELQAIIRKQKGMQDHIDALESRLRTEDKEKEIKRLNEVIANLHSEIRKSTFSQDVGLLTGPITKFLQYDSLKDMLIELDGMKGELSEQDILDMQRVIDALRSAADRARSWAERLVAPELKVIEN